MRAANMLSLRASGYFEEDKAYRRIFAALLNLAMPKLRPYEIMLCGFFDGLSSALRVPGRVARPDSGSAELEKTRTPDMWAAWAEPPMGSQLCRWGTHPSFYPIRVCLTRKYRGLGGIQCAVTLLESKGNMSIDAVSFAGHRRRNEVSGSNAIRVEVD